MNPLTVWVDSRFGTWVDTVATDGIIYAVVVFATGKVGRFAINDLEVKRNIDAPVPLTDASGWAGAW